MEYTAIVHDEPEIAVGGVGAEAVGRVFFGLVYLSIQAPARPPEAPPGSSYVPMVRSPVRRESKGGRVGGVAQ